MPLENPRYEKFCRFVAQGSRLDEAYREAGYQPNRHNAAALARKPHVAERIAQINTELSTHAAKAALITVDSLVAEAEEARVAAMATGQPGAACTAVKIKSVLSGKWIERQEIGSPGEYDSLTDDELQRQIMERVARFERGTWTGGGTQH